MARVLSSDGQDLWTGGETGRKSKAKDEVDHLKQAEKKKRRLEEALATSPLFDRSWKRKKKKKEEQHRLDEEGAHNSGR
ncbi:hypothetical protein IFM89_002053 [Coptis chinensis]|uniref:Uncharacterized protein n=1 Tax=Coptis chinensis TaxID=261450 RepID=A0A835HAD7_9MAGN|nr:hypothetical protein IFM89_002053 [Coptis chinensis]